MNINDTFNNISAISWRSVLLLEESGVSLMFGIWVIFSKYFGLSIAEEFINRNWSTVKQITDNIHFCTFVFDACSLIKSLVCSSILVAILFEVSFCLSWKKDKKYHFWEVNNWHMAVMLSFGNEIYSQTCLMWPSKGTFK
jgi:hypothetical protein